MLYSFSEQVSPRHSDKIADQIADALLDAYLKKDDKAKTAIEVFIKRQLIFIGGEVNSSATIDHVTVVRNLLTQLRCTLETSGIDPITCDININIQHQSKELSEIANQTKILSADQSISVGYATNENKAFLPSSYWIANLILQKAYLMQVSGEFKEALPDMKAQAIGYYDQSWKFILTSVILSIQHQAAINLVEFREFVKNKIIWPTLLENNVNIDPNIDLLINSYSYFHIGGPQSDSGLTGRKIIADTYGCDIPHGGGSFSGKDASKIDRTGAYVARYIAKNIVAAGIAKRCLITLNFLIGDKKVYKIGLNTFDTAIISNQKILAIIDRVFPLEVDDIVSSFALTRPKFQSLSTFGHFLHKNDDQQWEITDKAEAINLHLKNFC